MIHPLLSSTDFTWDFVTVSHWSSVEVNAAVVCACLLATKPLIAMLWSKLRPVSRLRVRTMNLRSGPPTIGSETIRGTRLPSSLDRLERRYGSDRVLLSGTEVEDSAAPVGKVGQQYAAAMNEVAPARQGKLDV